MLAQTFLLATFIDTSRMDVFPTLFTVLTVSVEYKHAVTCTARSDKLGELEQLRVFLI
jgi:hypothetical protein